MTNREKLLAELAEVDDVTFDYLLLSRQSDLPEVLEDIRCADCKAQYGGICPAPGDDDSCVGSTADWLSQECRHEELLSKVPI